MPVTASLASLQSRIEPPVDVDPAPIAAEPILALDGLRGLAILLVLGHNFEIIGDSAGRVGHAVTLALDLGWIGVQLFFVLSGFLITRILLATQESPRYYRSFYVRRMLRIFPLYYAVLFLTFVVWPRIGQLPPGYAEDQQNQAWMWLYLSNWVQPSGLAGKAFPHFWSLAVEEQFYLVWPALIHRMRWDRVLKWCLAIAALSLLGRIFMVAMHASSEAVYMWTTSRMDALALGAAAAAFVSSPYGLRRLAGRGDALFWSAAALSLIGFALTRGYPRTSPLGQTLGYSWLSVTFAVLVLAAATPPRKGDHGSALWRNVLCSKPLRTLGMYSYGMYIFHKPLHDLIGSAMLREAGLNAGADYPVALAYVALATAATLVLAMLSYHFLERRFLNLKQRFAPR